MHVCPQCESEFRDDVSQCDDCHVALLDEAAFRAQRAGEGVAPLAKGTFVTVITADDPFDAEAFVAALHDLKIPTISRARRKGTVDVLVTPGAAAFYEIAVAPERAAEARAAIANRKSELESEAAAAAQAAEEEEAATENHEVVAEAGNEADARRWAERLALAGIAVIVREETTVEAESTDAAEAPRFVVLVPREHTGKAKSTLLAAGPQPVSA